MPTIRWYFYGKLINFSSYHSSKRTNSYQDGNGATISFLNISTIELDDGGYYTCEAINDVASVSHSSNLHVFGPPIVHQMDNLTVASSSSVDIHCQYSGYPMDRILWAKGLFSFFSLIYFSNLRLLSGLYDDNDSQSVYAC